MLHLEKNQNIQIRPKEKKLNRTLLQAFLFAAAFHLLGFTLFRVTPFQSQISNWIYPPIEVEAVDLSSLPKTALNKQNNPWIHTRIKEPLASSPNTSTSYSILLPSSKNPILTQTNPHLFKKLEQSTKPIPPPLSLAEPELPVILTLAGPLTDWPHHITHPVALPSNTPKIAVHLSYEVRVDHKTGQIFYTIPIHEPQDLLFENYGKNVLAALRFSQKKGFVSQGIIDLYIRAGGALD